MLAFMCFSTLWSFGNVLNGFMYFNGTQVIFSWILMFALYFVPYALMVGELGSAFKNSGGGVSSWIHETTGAKAAYYAGWTYWACHVTYIAAKGSGGLKALVVVYTRGSSIKAPKNRRKKIAMPLPHRERLSRFAFAFIHTYLPIRFNTA